MAKTYNVGRLSVEMVADTVQYVQKLKAADKQTKETQSSVRGQMKKTGKTAKTSAKEVTQFEKSMTKMGQAAALVDGPMGGIASRITAVKGLLSGGGGVIAGVGILAAGTGLLAVKGFMAASALAQQHKELQAYAAIAEVTARELYLISSATTKVGISSDKFGDIVKDVRDKLGDFVATGGGPFKDVFEVLGDKTDLTAESLQRMSGPDALEAVAHAMEAANIPMSQQIFLMESIGNDAAKLIPLYKDQSKALNEVMEETENTTYAVSDQAGAFQQLTKQGDLFGRNFSALAMDVFGPLAGFLADATREANLFLASMDEGSKAAKNYKIAELKDDMYELTVAMEQSKTASGRLWNVLEFNSDTTDSLAKRVMALRKEIELLENESASIKIEEEDTPTELIGNNKLYEDPLIELRKVYADYQAKKVKDAEKANKAIAVAEQEQVDAMKALYEQDQRNKISALNTKVVEAQNALNSKLEEERLSEQLALFKAHNAVELETLTQQYAKREILLTEYNARVKAARIDLVNKTNAAILKAEQTQLNSMEALYEQDQKNKIAALSTKVVEAQNALNSKMEEERLAEQLELFKAHNAMELETLRQQYVKKEILLTDYNAKVKAAQIELSNKTNEAILKAEQDQVDSMKELYKQDQDNRIQALQNAVTMTSGVSMATDDQEKFDEEMASLNARNDLEMEMLRQQYSNKEILEDEYNAKMKNKKEQYYSDILALHQSSVNAEMSLYRTIGQGIGDQISALAGATDEEKDALTKQFLVKQSMAAANATLDYFATLSAHEAAAASLGVGGSAYLATQTALASTNYAKNLAGIGAVTLGGVAAGQFHSGTDQVPSEGSYLLQKGERVVQPEANKDLTSFLNGGGEGGGGGRTEINAPVTIQGNVTDQAWFAAALMQQRDVIAAAQQKVSRERPTQRRR